MQTQTSWVAHKRGVTPKDPRFQSLVLKMDVDDYLPYVLTDPEAKVAGTSQHPLQHRLSLLGQYYGRAYRSFKNGDKLYIVRIE